MTDIEQKALELVRAHGGCYGPALEAAIEAHEADKSRHAAEMREQAERFSEAVKRALNIGTHGAGAPLDSTMAYAHLSPFILAKPDPLEESLADALCRDDCMVEPAERLRAALDARGLAIVKKEVVNGWKP